MRWTRFAARVVVCGLAGAVSGARRTNRVTNLAAVQTSEKEPFSPRLRTSVKKARDTLLMRDGFVRDALETVFIANQVNFGISDGRNTHLQSVGGDMYRIINPGKRASFQYTNQSPRAGINFLCDKSSPPLMFYEVYDTLRPTLLYNSVKPRRKPRQPKTVAGSSLHPAKTLHFVPVYQKETDVLRRVSLVLRHETLRGDKITTVWFAILESGPFAQGGDIGSIDTVQKGFFLTNLSKERRPVCVLDINEKGTVLQAGDEKPFEVPLAPLPKK